VELDGRVLLSWNSRLTFERSRFVVLLPHHPRESVVQATISARNSKLRYYIGILVAIVFFGGLLFKSWYEQHVFERDTARLLAYYKNVVPGSISDGDLHNAQYLVYKYRNKKEKLWKNLEKKYGAAVLEEHEWADSNHGDSKQENHDKHDEGEEEDLDNVAGDAADSSTREQEL
jgi:hypothetical protein